jgi:hypothetical protein
LDKKEAKALTAVVDEYFSMESRKNTTNHQLALFAEAVQLLGQSLVTFSKTHSRSPLDTVRHPNEIAFALEILAKAGISSLKDAPAFQDHEPPEDRIELAPSAAKINKMSKKQLKLYMESEFDVEIPMTDTIQKMRKHLKELINESKVNP